MRPLCIHRGPGYTKNSRTTHKIQNSDFCYQPKKFCECFFLDCFLGSNFLQCRPCFDRSYSHSDRRVLLDVDGTVDGLIPYWGFITSVDHINFDLNSSRKWIRASVLSNGLQCVRGSLVKSKSEESGESGEKERIVLLSNCATN
jgi:hypothetical protein